MSTVTVLTEKECREAAADFLRRSRCKSWDSFRTAAYGEGEPCHLGCGLYNRAHRLFERAATYIFLLGEDWRTYRG